MLKRFAYVVIMGLLILVAPFLAVIVIGYPIFWVITGITLDTFIMSTGGFIDRIFAELE